MFIFLNKTCFRGVFRVGPKGFNVPYGHYNNPEIINKEHLDEIHELIKNVIFECCDFNTSLNILKIKKNYIKKKDFILRTIYVLINLYRQEQMKNIVKKIKIKLNKQK